MTSKYNDKLRQRYKFVFQMNGLDSLEDSVFCQLPACLRNTLYAMVRNDSLVTIRFGSSRYVFTALCEVPRAH